MRDEVKWTLLVTGASRLAGYLARKTLSRGWSHLGAGPSPSEAPASEVSL